MLTQKSVCDDIIVDYYATSVTPFLEQFSCFMIINYKNADEILRKMLKDHKIHYTTHQHFPHGYSKSPDGVCVSFGRFSSLFKVDQVTFWFDNQEIANFTNIFKDLIAFKTFLITDLWQRQDISLIQNQY